MRKLEKEKFPSDIILYYYDDGNVKNVVTDIVGRWQSKFSAFVNIEFGNYHLWFQHRCRDIWRDLL